MDTNSIVSAEALASEGYVKISKAAEQLSVDVDTLVGQAAQGKLQLLASITRNQAVSIVWPDKALPPEVLGLEGNFFSSLTAATKVVISREQAGILETTGSLTFNYFLMPELVIDFLKRNKLKKLATDNISPVRLGFSSTQRSLRDRLAAEISNIEDHNLPKDIFYLLLKARYAHEEAQSQKSEVETTKFNIPEELYDDLSKIPWSLYSINSSSVDYSITTKELFIASTEINKANSILNSKKSADKNHVAGYADRHAVPRELYLAAALYETFLLYYDVKNEEPIESEQWIKTLINKLQPANSINHERPDLWKDVKGEMKPLLTKKTLKKCFEAAILHGKTLQEKGKL